MAQKQTKQAQKLTMNIKHRGIYRVEYFKGLIFDLHTKGKLNAIRLDNNTH